MVDELDIRQRLLGAALEAATVHGIARLSMADVAQRAGLSRQTLYRHFASKEMLIAELVAAETAVLVAGVVEAARLHDDPRASLEAAFGSALVAAREHPLLDRLIRTEPETLLPLLTTDGGPVTVQVRTVVEAVLAERAVVPAVDGTVDPVDLRRFADIVTRLLVSYAVSAPDDPPEVVASAIARFLIDGVSSRDGAPTTPGGHS